MAMTFDLSNIELIYFTIYHISKYGLARLDKLNIHANFEVFALVLMAR